ncbi:MAG: class I SAM-dependent methyltransferase [Saprospiraceae bacterium]|nr:class I SAM-dependent methyltransferase [Saprospiraceae bacterium]
MELSEAITLIQPAHPGKSGTAHWADLGCGAGLFSFALAHLLPVGSKVYASDRDPVRLLSLPCPQGVDIQPVQLDFVAQPLPWQALDGILMANSLHYVSNKKTLLVGLIAALKPEGQLIIVEYDTDKPVPQWVPYPVSFRSLQKLFADTSFSKVEKVGERASLYGRAAMYAASVSQ